MDHDNDIRIVRERQSAASDRLDRGRGDGPVGAAAVLAQTVAVTTYPTAAQAYYGAIAAEIDGTENEGDSATYVQQGTQPTALFFAWNAGTEVPPVGTTVVCHAVGGRWVFRYDAAPSP